MKGIVLYLFAKGIKAGYLLDEDIREEFSAFNDNFYIKIDTHKKACLVFYKENGKICYRLGEKAKQTNADIEISFKSEKAESKVLLGMRSIQESYARHDTIVKGDIFLTMRILRIFEKVECYLLPKFMTKKLFSEMPKLRASKLKFYTRLFF